MSYRNMRSFTARSTITCTTGLLVSWLMLCAPHTTAAAADVATTCQAKKLKAAASELNAELRCHVQAANLGVVVDAACVANARALLTSSFTKAEAGGGCATSGDAPLAQVVVGSFLSTVTGQLRPTQSASTCAALKLSTTASNAAAILKAYASQRRSVNFVRLENSLTKKFGNMKTDFSIAEAGGNCATSGAVGGIMNSVYDMTGDVVERLWPVSVPGVQFSHPSNWHLDPLILVAGGRIVLNTYGAARTRGSGAPPPAGADIAISPTDLPAGSVNDAFDKDYPHVPVDATVPITVDGNAGMQFTFHDDVGGATPLTTLAVYVPRGARLHRFLFRYYAADSTAPSRKAEFDSILDSARLAP